MKKRKKSLNAELRAKQEETKKNRKECSRNHEKMKKLDEQASMAEV